MCAIFGIVGRCDAGSAEEAFALLNHRGPDDSAAVSGEGWWLGVHRLAIESDGEAMAQPLEESGAVLLFNGEIYNYRELAAELGIAGADEARTLLAAWRRWGDAFVRRLRGMYAVAVYEKAQRRLHLYRDPAGKKPLYWLRADRFFAFASEAKALYALKPFHLQRRHLVQYLGYQATVAPDTLDREVRKLEPGECLRIGIDPRDGGWKMEEGRCGGEYSRSVYDPWLDGPIRYRDESSAASAVEEALKEAVALRIPRKVGWGVLLSGGLDSSLVAAMAARDSTGPVRTFSIGYEGYAKYDERSWARKTAEHLGTEHREVAFGRREFFETLEAWIDLLDEPLGDPAAVPLLYLMERASGEGVRVLLGGEGSDELFLGYWTYRRFFEYDMQPQLPDAAWLAAHLRRHYAPNREWEWTKRLAEGELLFRSTAELYTDLQLARLLKINVKDGQNLEAIARYRERFESSGRSHPADWYSYLDLKVMLGEVYLVKQDRVSMAAGIEARSPFLDRRVIETAFAVDPELRMQSAPKGLLKKAAEGYLPEAIVHRKKKGLNYPFIEWILADGGVETIFRVQERTGLFREEQLAFLSRRADRGKFRQHLFPLYLLARWLERRI
jgi:asparagine synthase (glutamine-hydrolysing)